MQLSVLVFSLRSAGNVRDWRGFDDKPCTSRRSIKGLAPKYLRRGPSDENTIATIAYHPVSMRKIVGNVTHATQVGGSTGSNAVKMLA